MTNDPTATQGEAQQRAVRAAVYKSAAWIGRVTDTWFDVVVLTAYIEQAISEATAQQRAELITARTDAQHARDMFRMHLEAMTWTDEFQSGGAFEGVLMCGDNISSKGGQWLVEEVKKQRAEVERLKAKLEVACEQLGDCREGLAEDVAELPSPPDDQPWLLTL